MSLVADPFPEDPRIVTAEVASHLREIDTRRIADSGALAHAWVQLHRCDSAVMDSLGPGHREHYQAIVDGDRLGRRRTTRWSDRNGVRAGVAHLRVAVHRRLVLLELVERDARSDHV